MGNHNHNFEAPGFVRKVLDTDPERHRQMSSKGGKAAAKAKAEAKARAEAAITAPPKPRLVSDVAPTANEAFDRWSGSTTDKPPPLNPRPEMTHQERLEQAGEVIGDIDLRTDPTD